MNTRPRRNTASQSARKKLWEIPELFHCSIIGTCLTLDEARKIIAKAGFQVDRTTPDYHVHGTAVSHANTKNRVSEIIQKTLEAKYCQEIITFSRISGEAGLREVWSGSLAKGRIAGEYWSIMTHPDAPRGLLECAFGEVHMLSHINGASKRGSIQEIQHLHETIAKLESEKRNLRDRIKCLEKRETSNLRDLQKIESLEKENFHLKQQNESLQNGETIARIFGELKILANLYETEKYNREKAEHRIHQFEKQVRDLEKKHEILEREQAMRETNAPFTGEHEDALPDTSGCGPCSNREHACRALNGKHILYVGGKPSSIPHFKTVVEKNGGVFIHHDGGMENSFSMLAEVIKKADTIFCPLDCISHNACKIIKRMCARNQKECILLRSSGMSSFSRALDRVELNSPSGRHIVVQ